MVVMMRIYRVHDYDLMILYESGLDIVSAAKSALIAFYNEKDIDIEIPKIPDKVIVTKSIRGFSFNIDNNDADGIEEWINQFKVGSRNNLFKNILRQYLKGVNLDIYTCNMLYKPEERQKLKAGRKKGSKNHKIIGVEKNNVHNKRSNMVNKSIKKKSVIPIDKEDISEIVESEKEIEKNNINDITTVEEPESTDFDAFDALSSLRD